MMFLVFLYFLFDIYLRPQIVLDLYFLYDALDNNISPHVYMYGYDLNWTINDVYIMILNMFVFFLQENNVIISHCYRYSRCNHTHNFPKITNEVEVGSISVQREWEPGVISIRIIYWDMRKNSVSPIERNSRAWKWWKRSKCQQKGEKSQSRKELAFRFFLSPSVDSAHEHITHKSSCCLNPVYKSVSQSLRVLQKCVVKQTGGIYTIYDNFLLSSYQKHFLRPFIWISSNIIVLGVGAGLQWWYNKHAVKSRTYALPH